MANIPIPSGGTLAGTLRMQPPEELSSAIFGWGGFVNFVDGVAVQTVENVVNVTGLGQNRQEYPTGSPADTHEEWALGRMMVSQPIIECWMSRRPDAENGQIKLLDAHDGDEDLSFAIGLGDQFVYLFEAKVKSFAIDANIESPVRLQLVLRPSGALTRAPRTP